MPTKKELEIYINLLENIDEKQKQEIERLEKISGENEIKELKSIITDLKLTEKSKDKHIYSLDDAYDKLLLEASNLQQEKEDIKKENENLKIQLKKYKERYG
jgi:chromosome segregation ATPase